jgi:small-conductance mechanosensitive channel
MLREQTVSRYLASIEEKKSLINTLKTELALYQNVLSRQIKAVELNQNQAKRIWAAALIQIRVNREEIAPANIPAELKNWLSRDTVLQYQDSLNQLKKMREETIKSLTVYNAPYDAEVFLQPLRSWLDNLTQQISLLGDRLELEREFDASTKKTTEEFEKQRYKRRIQQLMNRDEGWIEKALMIFLAQHVVDTDRLLLSYYERLSHLEKRLENVKTRRSYSEKLIKLAEARRTVFLQLESLIPGALNKAKGQLDKHTTQVKVVLNPAQMSDILADFEQRSGMPLATDELPELPESADSNVIAQAKAHLIRELFVDWAHVLGLTYWQKTIRQAHEKLGTIDTEIDQMKDHLSSIGTREQELRHKIARLSGHSKDDLVALPEANRPKAEQQIEAYLKGEIAQLREERRYELKQAAAGTLIWLLVIPFIALMAIYIVRFIGKSRLAKLSHEIESTDNEREARAREDRFKMLFHVFSTGWSVLVIIIAIIYMFKALGMDIIPLLASAGVLGLAVAFGAQQLVRDFLSGFFILLENQFRPGERATVNGIHGQIVKVNPRLTVIRERASGSLHFIANGSIAEVDNFSRIEGARKIFFPVDFDSDQEQVRVCIQSVAEGLANDPEFGPLITGVQYRGIEEFKDYAIIYSIRFFTEPTEQSPVALEFNRRLQLAFKQANIIMPVRKGGYEIEDATPVEPPPSATLG